MKIVEHNSPNHYNGRNGWSADVLVCHQTGGDKLAPALNWYMNPAAQCSPNWVIDVDGTVHQLVHPDNAAYCNGTRTKAGEKLYYGLATSKIVKSRKTNANYYTYSIEFVHCLWGDINDKQVDAAVELIKKVIIPHAKKHGVTFLVDRDHIIGHCEIDPVTRAACPGKNFPYQRIIDLVSGKPEPAPELSAVLKAGDKVRIKKTADKYAGSSIKIPEIVKGIEYTIDRVSADKVRLQPINSWVNAKDVERA